LQASGPQLTAGAFRNVFYLIGVMAAVAILAGVAIPGAEVDEVHSGQP
jgi:hypothetical protein